MEKNLVKSVDEYFIINSDRKYICAICGGLLLSAFQSSCGCYRCCSSCKLNLNCEKCGKVISFNLDKALSKEVRNLKLNCFYDGCENLFKYEDYLGHISVCNYRMIECQECGKLVQQYKMKNHKVNECDSLEKKCQYCSKFVSFSLTKHLKFDNRTPPDCPEFYGQCINCGIENLKLRQHYSECTKIGCLRKRNGCYGSKKIGKYSAETNHEIFIRRDNSLGKDQYLFQQTEKCKKNKNQALTTKNVQDLEMEIYNMKEILDRDIQLGRVPKFGKYILIINNIKEILDRDIELYQAPRCGKYVWIINNIKKVLRGNIPLLSESMYSDEYGYKLGLKIYPQGDGIGKGQYLSVYYVIMKGDYDDILCWPFNKKVKITIFNQIDSSKSKSEIYRPVARSTSTERPTADVNLGTGNPTFISLFDLENKGFIRDGSLFIEISVSNDKTFL